MKLLLSIILITCAVCLPVLAHGDLDVQIRELTAELEKNSSDASLYLRRGELHRLHRDWNAALADFVRAEELQPALRNVELCRAQLYFDAGMCKSARACVEKFLADSPQNVAARTLRARILVLQGSPLEGAADFSAAIKQAKDNVPELYIERAQALKAAAKIPEGIESLNEGLRTLGPLITLETAAINLNIDAGNVDGALELLNKIIERMPRKEHWLSMRGDILLKAGRATESLAAYRNALAAIDSLPEHCRIMQVVRELESRVRAQIEAAQALPLTATNGSNQ